MLIQITNIHRIMTVWQLKAINSSQFFERNDIFWIVTRIQYFAASFWEVIEFLQSPASSFLTQSIFVHFTIKHIALSSFNLTVISLSQNNRDLPTNNFLNVRHNRLRRDAFIDDNDTCCPETIALTYPMLCVKVWCSDASSSRSAPKDPRTLRGQFIWRLQHVCTIKQCRAYSVQLDAPCTLDSLLSVDQQPSSSRCVTPAFRCPFLAPLRISYPSLHPSPSLSHTTSSALT